MTAMTERPAAPPRDTSVSSGLNRNSELLGQAISAARASRKWTLEDVAQRSAISRKTLSRVEKGQRVHISTLTAIEPVFEVPSGALVAAYYGNLDPFTVLNLASSSSGNDLPSDAEIPQTRDRFPRMDHEVPAVPAATTAPTSPRLPTADQPLSAVEVFALVRRLPPHELRQLRDWTDGVLQFLEAPERAEQINRAVAAARQSYLRWCDATTDAAIARRQGDRDAAAAYLAEAQRARTELETGLERAVPQMTGHEMSAALARLQREAAEDREQEG